MRRITRFSKCEMPGCNRKATEIATGRDRFQEISLYCEKHALVVEDDAHPEYTVECPNCNCRFGVN
jgi:hypothetical protein